MKLWIIILPALLILAACSSTRLKEVETRNVVEYDSLKTAIQQNRTEDSLMFEQLQKDILMHRQSLMKANSDIDVLSRQLENLLESPKMKISISDIDTLKLNVINLQAHLKEQSELLKFTSDRITTVLEETRDNSIRVVDLEKQVASIKQNTGPALVPLDSVRGSSAFQTIASLEGALASTQKTVKELQDQIANISNQLQTLISDPNVKPNPNVKADSYQNQLNQFKSQLDDLKEYFIKLEGQVSGSLTQKDRTTAEQPLVKIEKAKLEIQNKIKTPVPVPAIKDADARILYEQARNVYENRNLDKALSQFREFLRLYPEHELAPNAQYWLGETYFAAEEFQKAIDEFQKMLSKYPDSGKAPDAQYKIGMSYLRLGNMSRAKEELLKVSRLYPDYERMSLVDKQLNYLK